MAVTLLDWGWEIAVIGMAILSLLVSRLLPEQQNFTPKKRAIAQS
jgi:hypothetical protein